MQFNVYISYQCLPLLLVIMSEFIVAMASEFYIVPSDSITNMNGILGEDWTSFFSITV